MAFTHLHVHTEYSLLDGSNKIKEYVARVKELGMNSAAITDHGVMYGVIDFYRAAKEAGIKPILGCEVYVAPNSRFDKELTVQPDSCLNMLHMMYLWIPAVLCIVITILMSRMNVEKANKELMVHTDR